MLTAVLDTNIWVSAVLSPHGFTAKLIDAWRDDIFDVVVSLPLLEEIADILARPRIVRKFGITPDEIENLLKLITAKATVVTVTGNIQICRDPDDDLILETAIQGGASHLVSRDDDVKGDQKVIIFMRENSVEVVTVDQFLRILTIQ